MRKYIAMPLALFRVSLAIVVLLLTVSCTSLPNNSISYSAEWDRELVDGKAQLPRALIRTSDGGYAVAGYGPVELVPGGVGVGVGFWTVKLDQNGKVLWQRAFAADAPKREEGAYTLAETRDGGVLVVGMTQSDSLAGQSLGATADPSSGTRGRLGFLIAYGKDGALLWKKTLPSADRQPSDWFFAASTVADGYLLAGMSITLFENSSFHSGKRAAYVLRILKLDLQGNVVWDRAVPDGEYSIMHLCVANKIVLTPDGGFLVAISSGDDDGDRAKMDIVSDDGKVLGQSLLQRTVLVKFDHHGQLIKRAEFSAATEHIALGANADGYIVSGHEELLWYAFFDNDLNLKWKRAFVMPVWINSFWPAPDGGFYGAGMISQAAIAHISPTGELSQQIIHGMPDGSEGRDIAPGDRPDEFVVLWNRIVRTRAGLVKLRVPLQQIHAPH